MDSKTRLVLLNMIYLKGPHYRHCIQVCIYRCKGVSVVWLGVEIPFYLSLSWFPAVIYISDILCGPKAATTLERSGSTYLWEPAKNAKICTFKPASSSLHSNKPECRGTYLGNSSVCSESPPCARGWCSRGRPTTTGWCHFRSRTWWSRRRRCHPPCAGCREGYFV